MFLLSWSFYVIFLTLYAFSLPHYNALYSSIFSRIQYNHRQTEPYYSIGNNHLLP